MQKRKHIVFAILTEDIALDLTAEIRDQMQAFSILTEDVHFPGSRITVRTVFQDRKG